MKNKIARILNHVIHLRLRGGIYLVFVIGLTIGLIVKIAVVQGLVTSVQFGTSGKLGDIYSYPEMPSQPPSANESMAPDFTGLLIYDNSSTPNKVLGIDGTGLSGYPSGSLFTTGVIKSQTNIDDASISAENTKDIADTDALTIINTLPIGVAGKSDKGIGMFGESEYAYGVYGYSNQDNGIVGINNSDNPEYSAILGYNQGLSTGVKGYSKGGSGVVGVAGNPSINLGIYDANSVTEDIKDDFSGAGVYGTSYQYFANGVGVFGRGRGLDNVGVKGVGDLGVGVYGSSQGVSNTGFGVYGTSVRGYGVYGITGNATNAAAVAAEGPIVLKYNFVDWDGTEELQDRIKISADDSYNYITSDGTLTFQGGPVVFTNQVNANGGLRSFGTANEITLWGSKIDMHETTIDLKKARINNGGQAIGRALASWFYRKQETVDDAFSTTLSCDGDDLLVDCSAWSTNPGDQGFEGINITSSGGDRCQAVFNSKTDISIRVLCLDSANDGTDSDNGIHYDPDNYHPEGWP